MLSNVRLRCLGIVVILWAFIACCGLARGGQWQAVGLASDDLVSGRLLYDAGERVRVGGDVTWLDRIAPGESAGWRLSFVGTYDLVQEATLNLLVAEVPVTWYVGGLGGVLFPRQGSADATAALMTGLVLGSGRATIGIEGQYLLSRELWKNLADIDDTGRVLFYAALRF